MHKIGVISDTHGLLRPEVIEILRECELILHGGDINQEKTLDKLGAIAPVYAVRGNNDKAWAEHLPDTLKLDIYGMKIFMVHDKKYIPEDITDFDMVIYGHSHKYEERQTEGVFYLNPGSCGPRRFSQPITMAVLTVDNHAFEVKKAEIAHKKSGDEHVSELPDIFQTMF